MREYTTPTETLIIPGYSLSNAQEIFVTFSDKFRKKNVTITSDDGIVVEDDTNGAILYVDLTQEQTAMFRPRDTIDVQVNWITETGKRLATEVAQIPCWENLLKEVIGDND